MKPPATLSELPVCALDEAALTNPYYLKSLLEGSGNLLIRAVDGNFKYLFFNSAYRNTVQRLYEKEVAVGECMLDSVRVESDRAMVADKYKRALSGEVFNFTEHYGKNGEMVFENFFYPIKDSEGNVTGVIAFAYDITDRKCAEEELVKSEQRFRMLFMAISDGFYLSEIIADEQGNPCDYRYLEVNPQFEKIVGMSREALIGKRYREIVPMDDTGWLDNYIAVAVTGKPMTFDFFSLQYSMYFETYTYKTDVGQVAVFVRDVTERKRTDIALQNTQKLESLGILAGGIAHDFNNILCGLFGFIDLSRICLISDNKTEALEKLTRAMQSLDMLKSLTSQLLTFSKGGAPNCRVEILGPHIKNCCILALSGSNVRLKFDIKPDLALCECDKNQIAQVLTNIVINAQQAMPAGGDVAIVAENLHLKPGQLPALPAGGLFIKLSIKDHGTGIPDAIVNKIFDPFFTTKETGHGLGLSTAFSIIQQHHGYLDVETQPGKGTTFHMYLPAIQREGFTLEPTKTVEYSGSGPILVMDDDEALLSLYSEMIEMTGHTVTKAADGDEAVMLFKNACDKGAPFVLSFLDLTIKGGTGGHETLEEIRAIKPDAYVVAISGYANNPVIAHPNKCGFNDSLSKPFTLQDLRQVLLTFVKMHQ